MIYLATDHAGFELKEEIKKYLGELGMETEDMGAFHFDPDDDYPDFVIPAAQKVSENPEENRAIIFGASGQGEAIAANKAQGVRAAVYYGGPLDLVKLSRSHNNANVLSLGAKFLTLEEAKEAVKLWLETGFDGGRHERRIEKIKTFEQES
ncbi:MAG: RpiB/LacA/LacB family sugar-phosphate isomerase [Candidatus Wildermuthbacteria bacterium]|nr:RpiB/LacA/LacB family sugar-phosphate isomerase [Candidatus Wildermuthbacteria bacterium]